MKTYRIQVILIITLITALFLTGSAGASTKDELSVSLSISQSKFKAWQDVLITVVITNPTAHSTRLLNWFTPENGLVEPLFTVTVDDKAAAYTGAIYKRPAVTGADYITLKAGESLTYSVNLGEYYDLSATGQYEVFFYAASANLYNEKVTVFKQEALSSTPISFKAEGRAPKGKPTPPPPPAPGETAYDACTVDQQSTLVAARSQATSYASESDNYLTTHITETLRYKEWFGLFDSTRYNTVSSHFSALSDAWAKAGVTFHCKCKQNVYAYVYPDQPYHIYLCKVFWLAPLAGTDSQGGTLIHEMSHFYVVAGTTDYVYGQTLARSLAVNDPEKAILNADNHEYFAENTPPLP